MSTSDSVQYKNLLPVYTMKSWNSNAHLITSYVLNECLSRAAPQNVNYTTHQIYLNGPFRSFWFTPSYSLVILIISYLRVRTIETSTFPTDSSRPLFKQIDWQTNYIFQL